MKKVFALLFVIICTVSFVQAQSPTDEVELLQSLYGMEKKAIVEDFIKLDKTESAAFWIAYEAYEVDRKELGKKRVQMLSDYAENYDTMSDEKMNELVKMGLKQQKDLTKLIGKTYKKINATVGTKQATQFYQIENYLLSVLRTEIFGAIPFIGELEK